jgi:hypothetical protein
MIENVLGKSCGEEAAAIMKSTISRNGISI